MASKTNRKTPPVEMQHAMQCLFEAIDEAVRMGEAVELIEGMVEAGLATNLLQKHELCLFNGTAEQVGYDATALAWRSRLAKMLADKARCAPSLKFSTNLYTRTHGKAPRGRGHWAFCPEEHARGNDYLKHTVFVGGCLTLSEAKQQLAGTAMLPEGWSGTLEVMP